MSNIITEKNGGSAACCHKSQALEADAGAKGRFYLGAPPPGRMVDPSLKAHLLFLLKSAILLAIGKGGVFSYPIFFLGFCVLSILISSSQEAQCKNLPLLPFWPIGETLWCSDRLFLVTVL